MFFSYTLMHTWYRLCLWLVIIPVMTKVIQLMGTFKNDRVRCIYSQASLCNNICSYRSCSRARNHTGYWCCGMMIPAMYAQYCQHLVFCLSFFNGCQNLYIKYDSKGMMGNFVERFICVIILCINCNFCVWCWICGSFMYICNAKVILLAWCLFQSPSVCTFIYIST